jgi:hypothetical protein
VETEAALPEDALPLLAVAPEDFVRERTQLAKRLREAGKREEASAVTALRKPPRLVLALNHVAQEEPLIARGAVRAADRLAQAQARGKRSEFEKAQANLDHAVQELVVRAAKRGGSERSKVHAVVRATLASESGRTQLAKGSLRELFEPTGFEALAGLELAPARTKAAGSDRPTAAQQRAAKRDERMRELRRELEQAQREAKDAQRAESAARRAREAADRRVASLERDLVGLD